MDAMNASGVPHQSRPPREGMLLSSDEAFVETVTSLWPEDVMHWQVLRSGRAALDIMFVTPPDLLVVDMRLADLPGDAVLRILKSENVYRQICAVLCMDEATLHGGMDWATTEADDFVLLPATVVELRARLELAMLRATRTLDANPLTHLPGNTSILLDIQTRIDRGEDFGLGYADLDNFKAFNDKYGFSRGDEALIPNGGISADYLAQSAFSGDGVAPLFTATPLQEAALLGVEAMKGGTMTRFEKECDDAILRYLANLRLMYFGPELVVWYLTVEETIITDVRMILSGLRAGISPERLRERLRDTYV